MMLNDVATGQRVRQLAELAIIEAPLDPLVEQVCQLAAAMFAVPMASVTLIDATHQHFLARLGFDLCRARREDALCNVAIESEEPLIIPNTLADPRVCDSPFVAGDGPIRFYAGVPLSLKPGVPLGTICIMDTRPRTLEPAQVASLKGLAAIVVGQLHHHQSKRELAQQAIKLARRQVILSQSERFAKVGGFEADPLTGEMRWSDELHRLYDIGAGVTPTVETFLAFFPSRDQVSLRKAFALMVEDGDGCDLDVMFDNGQSSERHVHVHAEVRRLADGDRKIIGIVQDITERKTALQKLEWIATHDALTQLCNRAHFNGLIEEAVALADQFGQKVALFVLDIDRFKTINDTLGHDVGDAVLCAVGQRLNRAVAGRGTVARIGGDEFAILVSRYDAEGSIAALAGDILSKLREPFVFNGNEMSTRATFGVALYAFGDSSALALFKEADIALYHAKQAGRDGFTFYRPSMRSEIESRQDKLEKARAAVFAGKIEPYYQPKICLKTGRVVGFEALLRWHHPEKGLCAPGEMGDAFADRDLAVAIGRAMLYRVVDDLQTWRAKGLSVGTIAINAAEPEFHGGDYAERLISCLSTHGLARDAIEVEVTESVFLGHRSNVVAETMRKLSKAGISIALDDFGTGYASLTHLKQYPVTTIKVDRSFVMNIETSTSDAAIVDAVISLADALLIGVVAEGIETQAQLDYLRQRGCPIGQGYLFAKPMAGSRVPHFMANWPGLRHEGQKRIAG